MKISTILDQIDFGVMALPEFQRGYVWNRDQVRGLMTSLYKRHPVGSLLVWVTKTESATVRGDGTAPMGTVELLLDGQQRITSLYGIVRGEPPTFFDGNVWAFTGLHFNLYDETFEFYAPLKMKDNSAWVNVTDLMQRGIGDYTQRLLAVPEMQANLGEYINRLNRITGIKDVEFHIEKVTGEDKTVDVVVDIFNQVNSGGTKLSKGDLALARVCASWPQARVQMRDRLDKWRGAGFDFRLEWLLRCINALVTGEALFTALKDVENAAFRDGLSQAETAIDRLLNLISARLGLDHDRVLGSRYSFPVLARYLNLRGGRLTDYRERDKLLYWYIHTFLWGRYAGSTESTLNQDLGLIEQPDGALDRLIAQLRQTRGDLRVRPEDFLGYSQGARFYPLLYMLTRVSQTRDFESGTPLSQHLLGKLSGLQIHHLFPKAQLYKHGYTRAEVNALANFTFLTQETNLHISDELPASYMPRIARMQPGALESHWIPTDAELWKIENYREFLAARRDLLAQAANTFLDSLLGGTAAAEEIAVPVLEQPTETAARIESDEHRAIRELNEWLVSQGLPPGEFNYELIDADTGVLLATFDLAWPNGIQEGYSQPVALLIDRDPESIEIANRAGYRYFTDLADLRHYIETEVLALVAVEV
ncbi:MAG TPA: DUF262 domain-containing protein [Ktedonobacterales bacterium]|nr:DUF262 domain-containing protein [Ktedonobacterales bacterium]